MKKMLSTVIACSFFFNFVYAQNNTTERPATPQEQKEILQNIDSAKMLAEVSKLACNCIDSISLINKDNTEVMQDIKQCIDKQVTLYALEVKLFGSLKNANKNVTINLSEAPNAAENKKYYYAIEEWLRDSCSSLKIAVASQNKTTDHSFSSDLVAMDAYNKGIDLSNKEDYAGAIPYFKKAVKIDPNFAFAWDNLGISYRKTNDYDKALDAYLNSLKVDPKGKMPLQNIAIVYEFKKEYDKELEAYQNLIAIYPGDPETYYGVGRVYIYFKNDLEKGLDNMCKAYNLYVQTNSPYRVDAEKNIQYLYQQMKKDNKEDVFNKILKDNNITPNK